MTTATEAQELTFVTPKTITDWDDFNVGCGHCPKRSDSEYSYYVVGRTLVDVITDLGFTYREIKMPDGSKTVISYCSGWCKWRHGKTKGIHALLNRFGL